RDQKYLAANQTIRIGRPRCLDNFLKAEPDRLRERVDLLGQIDGLRRELDARGDIETLHRFQRQPIELILGGAARDAFDIEKEAPKVADRYGAGPWGRYTLMARRLVEAGVTFVTVDMPNWDDHVNIEEGHHIKLAHTDRAIGALVDDLATRG